MDRRKWRRAGGLAVSGLLWLVIAVASSAQQAPVTSAPEHGGMAPGGLAGLLAGGQSARGAGGLRQAGVLHLPRGEGGNVPGTGPRAGSREGWAGTFRHGATSS